jgi:anti-sigma B factor antagonist
MSLAKQALPDQSWLVSVSGRLEQQQTPDLERLLNELLADQHYRIVVDLSEVTYINSGGLRCLVTAWRHAKQQGGNVVLCCMTPRVKEVFSMVGFDKVFQIYPSVASATQAWSTS